LERFANSVAPAARRTAVDYVNSPFVVARNADDHSLERFAGVVLK
jgi:hypothetical protein